MLLTRAIEIGEALVEDLRSRAPADTHIQLAGSARRMVDAVKDIDLIATGSEPLRIAECLGELDLIESVSSAAVAGSRARTTPGCRSI